MAVWAIDWRDQIWMKLINLILFCFNKVQKSISWNLLGFKIYKYSQNYYTHQMLYQKKKIQYIFIHQVKDSSTFIFLASIQQMSNKWFLNKMHNISKQIEFAKNMICLHASIGQCSWIAPSHTTITFFPIFSNNTIKSISLFSFWTLKPFAMNMYTQIFIRLPLINI